MSSLSESEEYCVLSFEESLKLNDCKHASHCLLYTIDNNIYYCLLQLRFDGLIGFPGGEVDEHQVTVEAVIEATNRELFEEINYQFETVIRNEWICTHRKSGCVFVQHFFAKELTAEQFRHLERTHMNAEHFPSESLGVFRVPVGEIGKQSSDISRKFLSNFLRQRFAGNAKQQLMETLKKLSLLCNDDQKWIESNDSNNEKHSTNQIRAQTLINTELVVNYHDESVNAIYGLMVIRNDGLFDFIGTTFIEEKNKDLIIKAINNTLSKELSSKSVQIDSNNANKLSFNEEKELNYLFDLKISSSQFSQIESHFTEAENFLSNSFGIFRIPFVFRGKSSKACDYFNRFFRGYSKQSFAYNSESHFETICHQFQQNIL